VNEVVANPFSAGTSGASSTRIQTASSSQSEQRAIAEVQAAVLMAKRFPRDPVAATDRILNAFSRPKLAESSQYQYSKGGSDVSGPSIRAAEAIAQQWGNIEFGFAEKMRGIGHDGVPFSEVEAYAWDVETLARKPLTFIVRHWRDTKRGGYPLADEREIYELVANMAQRRVRACLLSILPGDVVEAAMAQADITMKTQADTSPEAMAKMVAAFADYGVTKDQIEARIQRRVDAITPAQVVALKKIWVSLRDGMSTAADWFEGAANTEPNVSSATPYPQDKFDTELKKWAQLVEAKKKTPEQIIAMASSKHSLTDAQKAAIQTLTKPQAAAAPLTDDDLTALRETAGEFAIDLTEVATHFGVASIEQLPADKLDAALHYIRAGE
jgi:hypothetical protein